MISYGVIKGNSVVNSSVFKLTSITNFSVVIFYLISSEIDTLISLVLVGFITLLVGATNQEKTIKMTANK